MATATAPVLEIVKCHACRRDSNLSITMYFAEETALFFGIRLKIDFSVHFNVQRIDVNFSSVD